MESSRPLCDWRALPRGCAFPTLCWRRPACYSARPRILRLLWLGNIAIGFENGDGGLIPSAYQNVPAFNGDTRTIAPRVPQFSVPAPLRSSAGSTSPREAVRGKYSTLIGPVAVGFVRLHLKRGSIYPVTDHTSTSIGPEKTCRAAAQIQPQTGPKHNWITMHPHRKTR